MQPKGKPIFAPLPRTKPIDLTPLLLGPIGESAALVAEYFWWIPVLGL